MNQTKAHLVMFHQNRFSKLIPVVHVSPAVAGGTKASTHQSQSVRDITFETEAKRNYGITNTAREQYLAVTNKV